jgi:hypothetical protein
MIAIAQANNLLQYMQHYLKWFSSNRSKINGSHNTTPEINNLELLHAPLEQVLNPKFKLDN